VILFLGDPAITADQLAARFVSLGYAGEVLTHQWCLPDSNAMVRANRHHEIHGPSGLTDESELSRLFEGKRRHITGLVTQFYPISLELIEQLPSLQFIGTLRSGTQNVDITAAAARGIRVYNNPGRNALSVADFAVGLMLSACRGVAIAHHALLNGTWMPRAERRRFRTLSGSKVGLVGFGAVGHRVARLLAGFDCTVGVYDPYLNLDGSPDLEVTQVQSLHALLELSDVVSLHAQLIGPDGLLVNTARAALLDEGALVEALRTRSICGAALDVFGEEPLPPDHQLRTLTNVTLTPHLAGSDRNAGTTAITLLAERLSEHTDRTLWARHPDDG
jgi:D-3-phosphoglycerate dehydrogenase